ncbi:MAG TPA: hypothetical protein VFG87_03470 [Amycolatopsis sp.]|nr:hypothetical protein [Amycolatopsis sp.]
MTILLPAALAEVFSLLSGQKWPEGDEDKLYALGDGLTGVGQQFSDVSGNFNAAAGSVLANVGGAPANQFYDFAAQLQGNLPTMSQTAVDLGTMSRNMGAQVEYAKYMIIVQLVWLTYEIAQWMILLPEAVPLFIEAADLAVAAILRRLLASAAAGGVSMAVMDLAVQGIQKLKGDRSGINWATTLGSLEAGALGGALGGAVFTFGSKAIGAVAKSALSDSSVVKKLIGSVDDPTRMEGVISGLSTSEKVGLGAMSTGEKVGLGMTNGVTMSGTMSATFGGPDDMGLSMASGAAGMLTGERRGSAGADGGGGDLPPDLDMSRVDSAAAKLTTPPPVPDTLGATGIGTDTGVTDPTSPANSSTVSETSAPTSVSTIDSSGLPGLATTLVDARQPAGGSDAGTTGPQAPGTRGGAGTQVSGNRGGQTASGATGRGTIPAETGAAATGDAGGAVRETTPVGGGRGQIVTESAGAQESSGAGTTAVGHPTAGEPATAGGVSPSGGTAGSSTTGTHEVVGSVRTGQTGAAGTAGVQGAPREVTEPSMGAGTGQAGAPVVAGGGRGAPVTGGGSAGGEAGATGAHTVPAEAARTPGTSTESSGPAPSVTGVSRAGGPADTSVAPERGAGVDPAAASSPAPVRPPQETASSGVNDASGASGVNDTAVSRPRTSGPVEPVVTGGSRAARSSGLPGLDTRLVGQPAPGRDGTTGAAIGQREPAAQASPGTGGSIGDSRDTTAAGDSRGTTVAGGTRDAVGQVPEAQSSGRGSAGRTAGPVDEAVGENGAPRTTVESAGPGPVTEPPARPTRTESGPDAEGAPAPRDPVPTDPPRPAPTESTGPHPETRGFAVDPRAARGGGDSISTPSRPSRFPHEPVPAIEESANGHGIRVGDNGRGGVDERTLPPRTAGPIDDVAVSGSSRPLPDHGQASLRDIEPGQPAERAWSEANGLPDSEVAPRPDRHAAEDSGDGFVTSKPSSPENTPSTIESVSGVEPDVTEVSGAAPHIAAPFRAQDRSGDLTRPAEVPRPPGLRPTAIRLSDLVWDVNREVGRLTKETGDTESYLPTRAEIVRIYRGLDEWKRRGTSRDIGERIAQIHLTGSEFKLRGGVNYNLVPVGSWRHVVESHPAEVLWHFSDTDPRTILREGFTARDRRRGQLLVQMQRTNEPGPFISTSRNRELWAQALYFDDRPYRFEIHSGRNSDRTGIDMDATLRYAKGENEVAFTGRIDAAAVVSVYDRERNLTGYWNPGRNDIDWFPGDRQHGAASYRPPAPAAAPSVALPFSYGGYHPPSAPGGYSPYVVPAYNSGVYVRKKKWWKFWK